MFTMHILPRAAMIIGALSLPVAAMAANTPDMLARPATISASALSNQFVMSAKAPETKLAAYSGAAFTTETPAPAIDSWNDDMVRSCVRTGNRMVC